MASSYDGPYDHDCGWLECSSYDCPKVFRDYSDDELADLNLKRDGSWADLPQCGDILPRAYSNPQYQCMKRAGHEGKHSQRGFPHGGWR